MDELKDRYTKVLKLFRTRDPQDFGQTSSEDQIRQCETALGVSFPESYRWFLRHFTASEWPDPVYGTQPLMGPDIVTVTLEERGRAQAPLPQPLVPFGPDGNGNHHCLDTAQMSEGECPVVFWNREAGADQLPKLTHPTFLHWLEERIEWELEWEAEEEEKIFLQ